MFADRITAGKKLAEKLIKYTSNNPLVIALPRGGVAVGFPVAQMFHMPLEVVIVRKIGAPHNLELGIGAIAEDNVTFWDTDMVDNLGVSNQELLFLKEQESVELERRKQLYRNGESLPLLTSKTVILVDDGLATGVTACAAILSIKKHHPKKIIFSVPVCSTETANEIRPLVDSLICLESPENLDAIGRFYHNFRQVTDDEVVEILRKAENNYSPRRFAKNGFEHKIVW